MQFHTIKLAGSRVLVTGDTDVQQTILDSSEWDRVKLQIAEIEATQVFDSTVEEFFAPIVAAAAAAQAVVDAAVPSKDMSFEIVVNEGKAGAAAEDGYTIRLGREAAILRMIEEGNTSRLIWVGSTIEITAL